MTIHEHLLDVGPTHSRACTSARNWAAQYQTAQEVWDNCKWADWLLWWAMRLGQMDQGVAAAKEIAQSVSQLGNTYATNAAAYAAAYAATYAATNATAATYATYAATYAAAATYATYAAAYAAAAAAGAKQEALNLTIVRKHLVCPWHETE